MTSSGSPGCAQAVVTSLIASVLYGVFLHAAGSFLTSLAPRGYDWGIGAFFGMFAMAVGGGFCFLIGSVIFFMTLRSLSADSPSGVGTAFILAFLLTTLLSLAWLHQWAITDVAGQWAVGLSGVLGLLGIFQVGLSLSWEETDPDSK